MSTITTILGNKGQGKSAIATYIAYRTFKAKKKDVIVANYKLNFPYVKMDFERLEEYKNALIIFDEAHLYVDRRTSMKKLNRLISYFVFEIRHLHSDLIFISLPVDVSIRVFEDLAPKLKENSILTDVCSVKNIFKEKW